ncbi:MAG TPA: hypothetical protein VN420_00025 [Candidatus Fimivivens sp.]|nr:hypothetical protein [Candidatus Fimivivens sp.]
MQLTETTLDQRLIDEIVNAIGREADAKNGPMPTICIIDDEGAMTLLRRGDALNKSSTVIASTLAKCVRETGEDGKYHSSGLSSYHVLKSHQPSLVSERILDEIIEVRFAIPFYKIGYGIVLRDLGGEIIGAMGVVAEDFETSKQYAEVGSAAFDERLTLDMRSQA